MTIVRRALETLLAAVLFGALSALAVAGPPPAIRQAVADRARRRARAGRRTGSTDHPGTSTADSHPPGNQYGGQPSPPSPPGNQYGPPGNQYGGPPGNQYGAGGGNGTPGGPKGCPAGGQYRP